MLKEEIGKRARTRPARTKPVVSKTVFLYKVNSAQISRGQMVKTAVPRRPRIFFVTALVSRPNSLRLRNIWAFQDCPLLTRWNDRTVESGDLPRLGSIEYVSFAAVVLEVKYADPNSLGVLIG